MILFIVNVQEHSTESALTSLHGQANSHRYYYNSGACGVVSSQACLHRYEALLNSYSAVVLSNFCIHRIEDVKKCQYFADSLKTYSLNG